MRKCYTHYICINNLLTPHTLELSTISFCSKDCVYAEKKELVTTELALGSS